MHYVTRGSHRMQKHKFGVPCSEVFFMKTAPGPPEHEKYSIDILWPKCTGMYYVTRRSHQMQKHKFGVTCPNTLFMKTTPHRYQNAQCDPQISPDAETQFHHNVSRRFLWNPYWSHPSTKNSASTFHALDEPERTT
jgi:hypothetical protein